MENLVAGRPIVFVWGVTVAIYGLDRTAGMAMQFPAWCVESAASLDAQEQLCVADCSRMDRVSAMKCSRDRHLAQTLHPGRNHWKVVAYACYASDKRASPWKGTSPARCSRCQRRNAGRGRARGASALDAICAFCPPSPDLVSSAETNSSSAEGPRLLSRSRQGPQNGNIPAKGIAAVPHLEPAQRIQRLIKETRDE